MEVATTTIGLTLTVFYICVDCNDHLVVEHTAINFESFIKALNIRLIVYTDENRCLGQFVRCAKCLCYDAVSSDTNDEYLESMDELVLREPLNTMKDIWNIVFLRTSEGYRVVSFSFCLPFMIGGGVSRFDLVSKTFIPVNNVDSFIGLGKDCFFDDDDFLFEDIGGSDGVNSDTSEAK
jgi:hypothetical protein